MKDSEKHVENQHKQHAENQVFLIFFVAAGLVAKMLPKSPPGEPPGVSRGLPGRLKSTNFSRQAAPQAANKNFCDAPGRPRAAPGGLRGGSGSRVCAQGAPRGVQGGILEQFWLHFWLHFERCCDNLKPRGASFACLRLHASALFSCCVSLAFHVPYASGATDGGTQIASKQARKQASKQASKQW